MKSFLKNIFKRRIKKGSIVEILNLNTLQIAEITRRIPQHEHTLAVKSKIGMRYRVHDVSEDGKLIWIDLTQIPDFSKAMILIFYPNQLRLV